MSALLRAMAQNESGEDEISFPMKEAQWAHLQTLHAATEHPQGLKSGERVRYREGVGPIKGEIRPKMVFMFWRFLDQGLEQDQARILSVTENERAMIPVFDCQIVFFDGRATRFDVTCSYLLERDDV